MRILLLLTLLLSAKNGLAQINTADTVYFNENWQYTIGDNYTYYRTTIPDSTTMPPTRLLKVTDHFKNGRVQMSGYVLADDTSKQVGMYHWYDKKGRLESVRLLDVKNSIAYFDEATDYLKITEPCAVEHIDLEVVFFNRGQVKSIGYYLGGSLNDTCGCSRTCVYKTYSPITKDLEYLTDYEHGKVSGRSFYYRNDERLVYESYYKDNKPVGDAKVYRWNGKLKKVIPLAERKQ